MTSGSSTSGSSAFDSRAFRQALGCFATGITVVTTLDGGGQPVGVTINSFASVSLDPPLVLFSLGRSAQTFDVFAAAGTFVVNVLSDDQRELSARFSGRTAGERWAGVDSARWDTGCPILSGCLANLECDKVATHDGGDHVILVGRVRRLAYRQDGQPLLYYRGVYAELGEIG